MTDSKFVHLHVHSEYSLLDGLPMVKELIAKVKELSMPAVALTDHGNMYGAIEFYQQALANQIKPIIGAEVYISASNRKTKKQKDAYHLTLLAQNKQGYRNLMKIVSIGYLEGFYYRPRVDLQVLAKYNQGVIALSGCGSSLLSHLLAKDQEDKARSYLDRFLEIYKDNFFIELQRHHYDLAANNFDASSLIHQRLIESHQWEMKVEKGLLKLSKEYGLPIVATNDVHYLKRDQARVQDVLVCIQTGRKVSEVNRLRMLDNPDYYLKTSSEMTKDFSDLPEAITNTTKIAESVDIKITLGQWFFPKFKLPAKKTAGQVLKEKVYQGAKKIYSDPLSKEVQKRIDYELKIIETKGYSEYFLIVQDMVLFAKKNNIITNTRGSAAGSLVAYCLSISSVDPLKFQLPFERFLNPYRPLPPDIDLDVSDVDREKIINYLITKYGRNKEAQICTFGRMLARASVRDVGRVLGYPYSLPDRLAKMIPFGSQGFPMTIKQALEISQPLKAEYDNNPQAKEILDLAQEVEGRARHISVHAAAVVVAPTKITDFTPVQYDPNGNIIITQYEMHASEAVGLIKFDLLGLTNLSILGSSIRLVKKRHDPSFKIESIPLDDAETLKLLAEGKTMGIFQLSSPGMTHYLKKLQPQSIFDIMAMVALYRPGPMNFIPEFINRRHDHSKIKFFDPRLKDILKNSYGIITYQDDVLLTAIAVAGYDWLDADKFRKAIGKKIPAEMQKQKQKFIKGCIENGMSKEKAQELFKMIEPFAGYGFNKAHAASYALIAYQTAYMKAHYPLEFMTPLLTAFSDNDDKLANAVDEAKKMGLTILPPNINYSQADFTIEQTPEGKQAIRFGLRAIKNVGQAAIDEIVSQRKAGGPFLNIVDFIRRINSRVINKKVLEGLIKAGAFDDFDTRACLLSNFDEIYRISSQKSKTVSNQASLFGDKLHDTIQIKIHPQPEYSRNKLLEFEKETFGFYLSGHPYLENLKRLRRKYPTTILEIKSRSEETSENFRIAFAAVLVKVKYLTTKTSRQQMAVCRLEDETSTIEGVIFPKVFKQYQNLLNQGQIYIFEGLIDNSDERKKGNFIIQKITPIEDKKSRLINIKISQSTSEETIKKLRQILKQETGSHPVVIWLEEKINQYNKVKLPYKIKWNKQIKQTIVDLLRPEAIKDDD